MKITNYKMILNEDEEHILVKESSAYYKEITSLQSPETVELAMNTLFQAKFLPEEHMWLLALNVKNKPIGVFELSHGTVNCCVITPREIFMRALLCGASQIILVHNHPSGEVTPSNEDDLTTKRVIEAGNLLSMSLLDHIIIGRNGHYSYLRDRMELFNTEKNKDF